LATVVITGCSSGFGKAAALSFARNGDAVVATVRNSERATSLRKTAEAEGLSLDIRTLELTSPDTFEDFVGNIINDHGSVDVLINNAGIIKPGACEDLTEPEIREVMETNFMAPMLLSRKVLPHMRRQGSGLIIMVSSLSGVAGLAGDVFYSASKFALEGATEALRHEVDRWGIRVALLEAGQYATDLFKIDAISTTLFPTDYPEDSPYRALVEKRLLAINDSVTTAKDPQEVADLMLTIAASDGKQLRWQTDEMAKSIVARLFGQSDLERDEFLRSAADIDWWSRGEQKGE